VSGKGVSAAILAQTLQGMVYAQLLAEQPLVKIARALNRFICAKNINKYATMVVMKLDRSGALEYINCGHIHPLLKTPEGVKSLDASNLPVGLIEDAEFHSGTAQLAPGDRVLLVTDGVTEAENEAGDFFGNTLLEKALAGSRKLDDVFASVSRFCGAAASADDCTLVEVIYKGTT
jgi:serine phosphatase RsbU (regulator of sigma subunit)